MNLKVQKKLAAGVFKCSPKKVSFDNDRLDDLKESITKTDIRSLIQEGAIKLKATKGPSRVRARKRLVQKRKGRRQGPGTRKGKKGARLTKKAVRITTMRSQRSFLKELREKKIIPTITYRSLYLKVKGGFFRSVRHIKLYIAEHKLTK